MTPEERLDRIEATFDRAAKKYENLVVRQVGIRNRYREGIHRMGELMGRTEHQDALLESLIDSQMRTEEALRRLEKTVSDTAESVKQLSAAFQSYLESQKK